MDVLITTFLFEFIEFPFSVFLLTLLLSFTTGYYFAKRPKKPSSSSKKSPPRKDSKPWWYENALALSKVPSTRKITIDFTNSTVTSKSW